MGSESPPSSGNDAYCIAGREVPQDKSKAVQEMLLVTQWVSVFSLEGQIGILWKSQSEACSRHALKRILGVSSQTQPRHANLLPFLTVGKKSLLVFYEVNCPVVPACLCTCRAGLWSPSVPTSDQLHMCYQSYGYWSLLCCVAHIAMTGK